MAIPCGEQVNCNTKAAPPTETGGNVPSEALISKGEAMRSSETGVDGTALDSCFLLHLVAVVKWGTEINRHTSG